MKAAEMRSTLDWLGAEVAALRLSTPEHARVIDHLEREVATARIHLANLDNLIAVGHIDLLYLGFPLLHELELLSNRVGVTYLSALQRQGPGERVVRGVLLVAAEAAGMTWVVDLVARLDGPHAAYVASPTLPIIYAPPRQATSLIDLPGLYHELGHAVREYDRTTANGQIDTLLRTAVTNHFTELARHPGPMTPERREARDKKIAEAGAMWTDAWLTEVFCDVFATLVCGPAHYASFVDLAIRHSRDPYTLVPSHPPLAARVTACHRALTLPHQQESVVQRLGAAWLGYSRQFSAGHSYQLACDDILISALVAAALKGIDGALPACKRYTAPLPTVAELPQVPAGASLEDLVNHAAALLFLDPPAYAVWEAVAMARCVTIAETALRGS